MKHITVTELKSERKQGSPICECMKEAIVLAANEWRNVVVEHNNRKYIVKPNDLIVSVKESQD